MPHSDPFFTVFDALIDLSDLPVRFTFPFNYIPHPVAVLAAEHLQKHLAEQQDWEHNFGLTENGNEPGTIIGKMFGVLVVKNKEGLPGYLAAFSGKLAGGNHHAPFVPPVFDSLADGGFLNAGMTGLTRMNAEIRALESRKDPKDQEQVYHLKTLRRNHSNALQKELYEHYHFLNKAGETKSLLEIFDSASYKNPPAGAGECAAPKLLQYAFKHNMEPVAMAEFWWGQSPKSDFWKHKQYYVSCEEKCRPILTHMLSGMDIDEQPD